MKLASLKYKRDGKLIVVSRDLTRMADATDIAPTLQAALDDWAEVEGLLHKRYDKLNEQKIESHPFDESQCASPLPRAYQWADGSAYVNHVELVRKARGAEIPASFWHDPLMYQGGSDSFLNPKDPIAFPQTQGWGVDFEGEIAVITDDVPMGATEETAASHIKLVMLVNDVSLRGLIPDELGKGFGFFQSKPSSAFSPVCVSLDELGEHWQESKLTLPLVSHLNGEKFGEPNAGTDMTFSFAKLVSHAAKTRGLCAGTIIGSGTVSNKTNGEPSQSIPNGGVGYSCIAEVRMIETIFQGQPNTPFMDFGDSIRIEMFDDHGNSIFGSIDQVVTHLSDSN
jgi:fumarylacetoacetate (FAA) hydrolase